MTPKIPDASHPITITPTGTRVQVKVGGTVIADTEAALTLQEASYPPVQYVPRDAVAPDLLTGTATSTHCPYKGDASYWSVTTAAGTTVDAAWSYETPYDAVAAIAGHLAFYPDRAEVVLG